MIADILFNAPKIRIARGEIRDYLSEAKRELGKFRTHTRNLMFKYTGSSAKDFNVASDCVERNFISLTLELEALLEKLDYAIKAKEQMEENLKNKMEVS